MSEMKEENKIDVAKAVLPNVGLPTLTAPQLEAALTEWDRRWREEPEKFMNDSQHLSELTAQTYGTVACRYLLSILAGASADLCRAHDEVEERVKEVNLGS